MPISGIVQTYFLELKERLTRELALTKCLYLPAGHWIIHEPYFAMHEQSFSDG